MLAGNASVEQSAKNALMALEVAGSTVPVHLGSVTTFSWFEKVPHSVFGKDGMGERDLVHPTGVAESKDAIDFILETVSENPDEIEIVMLGPATNIARAIARDPETMSRVKRLWSMGTTGLGPGNATPVSEFNVYLDAEAYKVVLDSGIPITIVGLDMGGGDAMWGDEEFNQLRGIGEKGSFLADAFGKIFEFYRSNGSDKVSNYDGLTMTCVLIDGFVRNTATYHGSCIVDKGETYGQVIFYKEGFTYDFATAEDATYNITLVTDVDRKSFFPLYKQAISNN